MNTQADRDVVLALITFQRDKGDVPSAIADAEKLVQLNANDARVIALLNTLNRSQSARANHASMKHVSQFVVSSLVGGLVIVAPIYLSGLVLLKAMHAVAGIVRPLTKLLPLWFPAEHVLSLLFVLTICFLIGVAARTPAGRATRERIEKSLFEKIPGYALFRSLTQQLAGSPEEHVWKPAMAEIEEALVPAFIIEEFDDGRFTVFVPSAPSPLSGSVYILTPERVHLVDVPFTHAIRSLSHWGSGSKELVAAMKSQRAA